jgi:phosphatidylserine/phosphatidylglycerophosphate/cardiolipin synthase-like enzyme
MKPDRGSRRDIRIPGEEAVPAPDAVALKRRAAHRFGPGVAVVLLVGLFLVFRSDLSGTETTLGAGPIGSGGEGIRVYFTAPQTGGVASPEGSKVDEALVQAIDQAQRSVDVAVYALNLGSVADALRRADQRGVRVRLVIESDNASEPEVQSLLGAGLQIHEDGRPGLMHHKFVIIDGTEVWTGSMNLTVGATVHDDNNLLRITSTALAQDFTQEFDEMFEQDRFGALSLNDTSMPRLSVSGVPLEVLFSPDDGVAERINDLIDGAETSLEFAAFSLTSDSIADHMLSAAGRGVIVRGVMETTQSGGLGSEYESLRALGLDVRLDANPFNMHHKFMIIDHETVVTGSYNFTISAEEHNDENVLIVHDWDIAAMFDQEFTRIFELAGPLP